MILQLVQIRCIAFLKRAVGEAMLLGSLVSSLKESPRNIDAQHVRSEFRCWQCRRAIAASEIQNLEPFCDSESLDKRLSAFSHALANPRKVAFFPKCFVWIHRSIHMRSLVWLVGFRILSLNKNKIIWGGQRVGLPNCSRLLSLAATYTIECAWHRQNQTS